MVPIRLCYLILDCLFDQQCKLPSSPFKDFTDTMLSGFNLSLVAKDHSLQSRTDDEGKAIDECLLSLERNKSDVVLLPYTMPVMSNNIKTGPVVFSDKIVIASTYKHEKDDSSPGVFGTFDAFGVDALTLILNFFVILAILICFTYILERKSRRRQIRNNGRQFKLRSVPWFIFRFFVKQYPSFPGNMTALKVLLTCCVLMFSYFVTFFYSSMIKTDMVTVKAPRVIASYQDILDDPQIEPYIRHTFDEYLSFKDAFPGSVKRKVWERTVKMGVAKHVFGSEWYKEDIVFYDRRHPFMNTKAAVMGYSNLINLVRYSAALILRSLKTQRVLAAFDPIESEKLSASVINRMTDEVISQKYEGRMKRFFEGHFYHKMADNVGLEYALFYGDLLGLEKDISDIEQYINERVVLPEPVLVEASITHFMPLFILYLVLCFVQLTVLLIENCVSVKE